MKSHLNRTLTLLLALVIWSAPSRAYNVTFDVVDSRELPSYYVKFLYQDSDGYIWMAHRNGLARYDGQTVVDYSAYLESSPFIYEIVEDVNGNLLLATDKGLISFDRISCSTEIFLKGITVTTALVDESGAVWVGTEKGLLCRTPEKDTFEKIDVNADGEHPSEIIDIISGENNQIWMTTWHKGLYVYDSDTGSAKVFKNAELKYSYVLHRDDCGVIWVGTWGHGLVRLDKDFIQTSGYEAYPAVSSYKNGILDDIIYSISNYNDKILVGGQKGLSLLDRTTGAVSTYTDGKSKNSLPYNQVNTILVTRNESVYVGMYGGGMCMVNMHEPAYCVEPLDCIKNRFSTNTVDAIFEDKDGYWWIGLPDHGFVRYNPLNDTVRKYDELPAFSGLLSISTTVTIQKRCNEICFGTYSEGLWVYDKIRGEVKVYSTSTVPHLQSNTILALENDHDGNMWVGTAAGLYILDPVGEIRHYCFDERVVDIKSSADGMLYVAAQKSGLYEISPADDSIRLISASLNNVSFTNVLVSRCGDVWAGTTSNGLYRYNRESGVLESSNPVNTLASYPITNMLQLSDSEICVMTDNDLVIFVEETGEVVRYVSDLDLSLGRNSAFVSADKLVAGTNKGILQLSLDAPAHDTAGCTLVITDVIINGRSYRFSEDKESDPSFIDEIRVKKADNVEVRYKLLDYNSEFSPIYHCNVSDDVIVTAEESLVIHSVDRKTIVQISHKPSGQIRTLTVCPAFDLLYLILILLPLCLFMAVMLIYMHYRPAQKKGKTGSDYKDMIVFEVNSKKLVTADEELLQRAMKVIKDHISDSSFSQTDFIHEMNMSRTLLTDKIKKLTGFTPNALILEIRLKTAYMTIISSTEKLRVSDVAYSVGFNDAKYFGTCFRKKYGVTPKELILQNMEQQKGETV